MKELTEGASKHRRGVFLNKKEIYLQHILLYIYYEEDYFIISYIVVDKIFTFAYFYVGPRLVKLLSQFFRK